MLCRGCISKGNLCLLFLLGLDAPRTATPGGRPPQPQVSVGRGLGNPASSRLPVPRSSPTASDPLPTHSPRELSYKQHLRRRPRARLPATCAGLPDTCRRGGTRPPCPGSWSSPQGVPVASPGARGTPSDTHFRTVIFFFGSMNFETF